jgi:hypothetical protein
MWVIIIESLQLFYDDLPMLRKTMQTIFAHGIHAVWRKRVQNVALRDPKKESVLSLGQCCVSLMGFFYYGLLANILARVCKS